MLCIILKIGNIEYILWNFQVIEPEGKYFYQYQTSNGIQAQEQGVGGVSATGAYSYSSPDGTPIVLTYTADENGFQPEGTHLPTPPPIPPLIQKALLYLMGRLQQP